MKTPLLLLMLIACAPRVPLPAAGAHEGDTPVPVPYPPPAARTDMLPEQPHDEAVWLDGYWTWQGGGYNWQAGRWVTPMPSAAYAPATIVRRRNGDLLYYPPRWHQLGPNDGNSP